MKVLFELEKNDCRYMMDGTFFCAEVQRDKSSYCDFHHRICWVVPIASERKARVYHGTDFAVRA